ncbi:hypothetical protein EDB83DRAFT_2320435 [Lactarius deliciosus]|nr:hypothetical protein EDB83DRAFT_2320435 [Lactarius deliciosus]
MIMERTIAEVTRAVPLRSDIVPISPRPSVPNSDSEDRRQYSSEGNQPVGPQLSLRDIVTPSMRRSLIEGTESQLSYEVANFGTGEIEQHAKVEMLPDLKIYFRLAVATDSALDDTSSESPASPTWSPWECSSSICAEGGDSWCSHRHIVRIYDSSTPSSDWLESGKWLLMAGQPYQPPRESLLSKSGALVVVSLPALEYESRTTIKSSRAIIPAGFLVISPFLHYHSPYYPLGPLSLFDSTASPEAGTPPQRRFHWPVYGAQLVSLLSLPTLAEFQFCGDSATWRTLSPGSTFPSWRLSITCFKPSAFDTPSVTQIDSRHFITYHVRLVGFSALLSGVQRLDMESSVGWLDPDEMDSALWLDVFYRLKSVTKLEVAGMFVPSIESALEQLPEEMLRGILSALHDLHEGNVKCPGPSRSSPTRASSPIAPNCALRVRDLPLTAEHS